MESRSTLLGQLLFGVIVSYYRRRSTPCYLCSMVVTNLETLSFNHQIEGISDLRSSSEFTDLEDLNFAHNAKGTLGNRA